MLESVEQLFTRVQKARFFVRPDLIRLLFCAVIIILYILLLSTGRLERAENIFLEYFFKNRPNLKIHSAIAIIEIDEESLSAIGRWPWPWHYHARMIHLLREVGAKAIVYDLIFEEANSFFENDELEKALEQTEQIYLPVVLETKPEKKFWVHSMPIVLEPQGDQKIWTHSASKLEKHVKTIGHINAKTDADGVLRRIPPYLTHGGEAYPHLALRVAYDYLGKELPESQVLDLPLDRDGNLFINWAGKWEKSFKRFSYADLVRTYQGMQQGLRPVVKPEEVKDKICLVGLTASEFAYSKVNPLEPAYPLLGVHANVINSILTRQFVVPASFFVNSVCLVLVGLVTSFLFVDSRKVLSFIIGLAIGGIWVLISFVLFWVQGIWIYVFHPFLLILTLFIFSAIYNHIVATIERARLFDLATRDGLTGLYVIRYFREILNRTVQETQMKKDPLSLILLDIDNFKPINDTYGHPAGDMVLKKIAKIIHSCLRSKRPFQEADFIARYGGEEFIIMLRKTTFSDATSKVAERIRAAVERATFDWEGKIIPVTISLGVAYLHDSESVPDMMVRRADDALYQAKKQGKNCVCVENLPAN